MKVVLGGQISLGNFVQGDIIFRGTIKTVTPYPGLLFPVAASPPPPISLSLKLITDLNDDLADPLGLHFYTCSNYDTAGTLMQ